MKQLWCCGNILCLPCSNGPDVKALVVCRMCRCKGTSFLAPEHLERHRANDGLMVEWVVGGGRISEG
jgi:hypothetical protein